jgi:D-glycero-alpha-D-manno-heptose-7-phosphate kinase
MGDGERHDNDAEDPFAERRFSGAGLNMHDGDHATLSDARAYVDRVIGSAAPTGHAMRDERADAGTETICMVPSTAQDRFAIEADAPARVDFTGGFTDVPPLVDSTSAVHVNAAVELRVHARVARAPGDSKQGWQLASDLGLQGVVVAAGAPPGVGVSLRSDAPLGAGLGASGAAAVAIVAGVRAWAGERSTSADKLARAAVEADQAAGMLGGSQDQYAAAYGSVRRYVFSADRCVSTTRLAAEGLEGSLLVVRAKGSRRSSAVVGEVVDAYLRGRSATRSAVARLHALAPRIAVAIERATTLELADLFWQVLAAQLDLHPCVADCSLLRVVELIGPIGGTGAKLLGAGGEGGSVLVVCPTDARHAVSEAAVRAGCSTVAVRFAGHGARIRALEGAMA